MTQKMVPDDVCGFAIFSKSGRVSELFQSRDLADQFAQSLGHQGYEIKYGRIETRTGIFVTPDLERQR